MSAVAGLGALPVVLDVVVGALDAYLLFWIYKNGKVLFQPPKMKLLPDDVGVLDQLYSINPLSDPINALSSPLRSLSTLLFGWNTSYGVLRVNYTYHKVLSDCRQAFRDGIGMPVYNTNGRYQVSPTYSGGDNGFVTGWYIVDFSWNWPAQGKPDRFPKEYVLGWNAGGSIVFDDD
jgi:hypothetical protein